MTKKLISLFLIMVMLSSLCTAFALEEVPEIDMQNIVSLNDVEIDLENLPTLSAEQINAVSLANEASTDVDLVDSKYPEIETVPRLKMDKITEIIIPQSAISDDSSIVQKLEEGPSARSSGGAVDSSHRMSAINSNDSYALSNQTGKTNFIGDNIGAEYVDPMTGNLVVTETDLVLPGRDGLDLNLSRYYSLAQAEVYDKSVGIVTTPVQVDLKEGMYVVTEKVTNRQTWDESTYYYPYVDEEHANLRRFEIETRNDYDGLYEYDATITQVEEDTSVILDYYYTSNIDSASYQTIRNNLGVGWSWSFPSVQTIKDDYQSQTEMPKAIYYHDGKGSVLEVGYDDLNGCWFENYIGGDKSFEIFYDYDSDICDTARIDYIVEESDGTKYYFGPYGQLLTIIDIYDNRITFAYDETADFYGMPDMPILTKITDTVGREVNFDYNEQGGNEFINLTIESPIEGEGQLQLSYEKRPIEVVFTTEYVDSEGNVVDTESEYISTEHFLEKFTNAEGEVTSYYPNTHETGKYVQPVVFTFADKCFDSEFIEVTGGYKNNLVYLLGDIIRPHSRTKYYYDKCERNLGHSGVSETFKFGRREEQLLVVEEDNNPEISEVVDSDEFNVMYYIYTNDYTGYPDFCSIEAIPEDIIDGEMYVASTEEVGENYSCTRDYFKIDGEMLEKYRETVYTNPVGNDLKVNQEVLDFCDKQPYKIKLTYSNGTDYSYDSYVYNDLSVIGDKTYGKPLFLSNEMDYQTAESSSYFKHGVSYDYYANTGFIKSKSWYKTLSEKCTESYTYTTDNRLSKVTAPDGSETTYSYSYTDGHVSQVTQTTENDTGTTVITENYTAETNYSLPSAVTKTVTANGNTTTETTSYTYNMLLGVVTSETDNDDNTTYYEYDNLGRVTRIVYPQYSTYSAYDAENIEILPVQEVSYTGVERDYENVVAEGNNLVAQAVVSELTYYNVTGLELTNPSNTELENVPITYYGGEVNYYLGTGEVVESNVLDKVESTNRLVITTYYYDTDLNTITIVDDKGDRIITQYDGLGREVKVTDAFDNNHIFEYNISSENVGFKAQSYFVPYNNTSAKENIVEYTYDRLQRVVSEKGFKAYPDSYSEVQYAYDLVGNVVGIKDAKGNLNDDGYTQSNTYDKLNRLTSSKNAKNEIISNTYDNAGNIKKQTLTDSKGTESILYQRNYDGEGKITTDTDNSGNSNTYSYNNSGELVQTVDKDNKIHSISYNELHEADEEIIVKPNELMSIKRVGITTPYGPSRVFDLKGIYDSDTGMYSGYDEQMTSYSYSPAGKLLVHRNYYSYSTGISGVSFDPYISYEYDSIGNITSALYGTYDETSSAVFGFETTYEYDKNRVSKVQTNDLSVQYEYYPDGKLKSIIYPALSDGKVVKSEYIYDGLSRLTSLTNYKGTEVISSYSYTYDNNGNILTVNETVGETQNDVAYTYDELNRILSVSGSKGADSYYEYDARGNRKANFEQIDFLSEETAEFDYNEEDKLYYAEVGENTTRIRYSSNGYRYVKQENSEEPEFYIYDSQGRLNAKVFPANYVSESGTQVVMYPINQYIWGPDRVLAQIDADEGKTYYYLYNGHGDVVQIIDTDGNIKNTYDYDVWGNFITKSETIDNPFTYFGQTYDESTGLYYLRARYYDPTTGRFTQQDPAEDGYNWYVYGGNNPVLYVDYTGMLRVVDGVATDKYQYGSGNSKNQIVDYESKDIKKLQIRLQELGYLDKSIKTYGYFGVKTLAAVNAFKKANGIQNNTKETNGVVGVTTWALLGLDFDVIETQGFTSTNVKMSRGVLRVDRNIINVNISNAYYAAEAIREVYTLAFGEKFNVTTDSVYWEIIGHIFADVVAETNSGGVLDPLWKKIKKSTGTIDIGDNIIVADGNRWVWDLLSSR